MQVGTIDAYVAIDDAGQRGRASIGSRLTFYESKQRGDGVSGEPLSPTWNHSAFPHGGIERESDDVPSEHENGICPWEQRDAALGAGGRL